jgi:hypothetical protein
VTGAGAGGRRTLLGVAALFFVPLALAFGLYYGTGWRPGRSTNHGELIVPARPLPGDPKIWHGHWTLVYAGSGVCAAACERALYTMRQTRLALGRDMTRVERVRLATEECCDTDRLQNEGAGLVTLDARATAGSALLRSFPADDLATAIFVVDPLGNLMMRFDSRENPKGLLQDLTQLLRLSQIG